jgi:hypothetical protein
MTIRVIRIIELLLLIAILSAKTYYLLAYILVMYVSMEFLNSRKEYTEQRFFKFFNILFIGYQVFICLERIRKFKLGISIEFILNSAEHILFALVICFKISQYMRLRVFPVLSLSQRFWITVLLFNTIGVFNEIWQNGVWNRALLVFIPDSVSDLKMNLIGTLIFSFSMLYESRKI